MIQSKLDIQSNDIQYFIAVMEEDVMHTAITCIMRNPLRLKKQLISIRMQSNVATLLQISVLHYFPKEIFPSLDINITSNKKFKSLYL